MGDYKPEDEMGWGVVFVVMACIVLFVASVGGVFL